MPAGRRPTTSTPDHLSRFTLIDRAPEYEVSDTDWGTMYAAYRPAEPGRTYWRIAHFLFPFWTHHAAGRSAGNVLPRLGADGRHPHDVRQPDRGSGKRRRIGLHKQRPRRCSLPR